jgi:aspartyl aminopeptidase
MDAVYEEINRDLLHFIAKAPSVFHAVSSIRTALSYAGFTEIREEDPWQIERGGKYVVTRNGSALMAFTIPEDGGHAFRITASHGDSPSFKIKENPELRDAAYVRLNVEGYGGMIMPSWLDRPLTVAGRLLVRTENGIESRLVCPDRALACIPNLCIHFNRDLNNGMKYNPQVDLQPIFGGKGGNLKEVLAAEAGVKAEDILDADLVLATREKAVRMGLNGEYFMSGRIDDLECAYTTLWGFLQGRGEEEGRGDIWVMFDNEEVGSSSRQGAQGTLMADVLARIEESMGVSREQSIRARTNSLVLSADNGHATHPNHPEKSDPANPVVMGGGVLLKYNARQTYTTSGFTGAAFTAICKKAGVPVQVFANRADVPGGSTLGNLLGHQILMPMVDIGLGQLAMHSAMETASCADAEYMAKAVAEYYNTPIFQPKDGEWKLGL